MKLPRAALAQWLSFDKKEWTLIGKDTDSMSTSMNPDIETKQNVLGETITDHKGFKPNWRLTHTRPERRTRSMKICSISP